jgi:hypothetical protein
MSGVKGALQLNSALLTCVSLLLAFASYAAKGWVEKVDVAIQDRGPRIERLETESKIHWEEVSDRLKKIETILEQRSREEHALRNYDHSRND